MKPAHLIAGLCLLAAAWPAWAEPLPPKALLKAFLDREYPGFVDSLP